MNYYKILDCQTLLWSMKITQKGTDVSEVKNKAHLLVYDIKVITICPFRDYIFTNFNL